MPQQDAPDRSTPTASPRVTLKVNGIALDGDVHGMTIAVRVDQALDKADMLSARIANPLIYRRKGPARLAWTDHAAMAPGGLLEVWARYEIGEEVLLGAGIIGKHLPTFPAGDFPELEVRAYDGLTLLMDGNDDVDSMAARFYPAGTLLHEMVWDVVSDYGFDYSEVEESTIARPAVETWKKEGMSDYTFLQGIAALVGYEFNVRWLPDHRVWSAIFRPLAVDEASKRIFTWGPDWQAGDGDMQLLELSPRFHTRGQPTDVRVFYMDTDTRTWEEVVWPPAKSGAARKEFAWLGDETTMETDLQRIGSPESARGLRIKAAGTSIEVIPTSGFPDAEAAADFAEAWWKARQAMFIHATGSVVGWPYLRPGQVHEFRGLGPLSGDWYIIGVEHIFEGDYKCEFQARKVIL